MDTPGKLVERLMSDIGAVAEGIRDYVRRPEADFTRMRAMGPGDVIRALVCMGTGAIGHELGGFPGAPKTCTPSAFCQQRDKIEPEALRQLLLRFRPDVPARALAGGLRLAAVDGTEVVMQRNPRDAETHSPRSNGSSGLGYNSVYATALLDMSGGLFLDAVVQPGPRKDEAAAFRELADRCDPALTLVGDRGFAGYNNFAHCAERGVGFVIRLKDSFAAGLLGVGADELPDEADEDVELLLTRSRRASLRADPGYRLVSSNMRFDYLGGRDSTYRLRLRVVRFAIGGGRFENLATSLRRAEHGPDELREIYSGRWGVETAFRDLKHAVGLARLHSATARGAAQEVYARMVLYNFCSAMAALAQLAAEPREGLKHAYAVNFAAAVRACRAVLWPRAGPVDGLLERIAANVCPVRPGRSFARHRRLWSPGRFSYRC